MGKVELLDTDEVRGFTSMIRILFSIVLFLNLTVSFAKEGSFELTTAVSGVVEKVYVKPGEKVKQGQLLLTLDQRVMKAESLEAESWERSAKLELDEAKKELERTEELYDRTVISDHELELAKINFAKKENEYTKASRAKVLAQYQLDFSQVVAPVSGKIKKVNAWKGMVVNNKQQNTVLITMVK